MPVTELRIQNYRSIRTMTLPMKQANVIVGPNGCGKTNLYQAVGLILAAAEGRLAQALLDEGGFPSALWAGPRGEGPVRMHVGVSLDEFDYDIELGLPMPAQTMFQLDPMVKSETISMRKGTKSTPILKRSTGTCKILNLDGKFDEYLLQLRPEQSVFGQIADPNRYPIVEKLRRDILKWRFYHHFSVDRQSPLRRPAPGVRTFVLAADGHDLGAALQTIVENGDDLALHEAFTSAFPGAALSIASDEGSKFEVLVHYPGVSRPMRASELSDGTLHYICLLAALLSPTPAPFLAVNEPESSLNEDLIKPLASLIARAANLSQIWLTTHSHALAAEIENLLVVKPIELEKVEGATVRKGRPIGAAFSAEWDT